ncbi:MAG: hypothetical protein HKO89_04315 [Saprospiraceae bacterium]|nr:hypothetical protein [Saprospiraceae bacterium]
MMKSFIYTLVQFITIAVFITPLGTLHSQLDMIETEEMSLVTYDFGHNYILSHAGRCFHSALQFHKELFDYEPSEKISLLIQDFGDYGNAGATAVPQNAISMGLSPFSYAFETSPAGERVFTMMNHELVHVVALDNANRSDRFFRNFFMGKVDPSASDPVSMFYSYLTNPRRYSPRWYHEGIASYIETWMSGGLGLALGSYDEMVFRTRILEDAHIYSAQGLESEGVTSDFQGRTNSYLYGTRFYGHLAYKYGPDKIIDWVKRNNGSRAFFSGQFKKVFGKKITKEWDEWLTFEREWQTNNINNLKQHPVTEYTPITEEAIGSVSYAFHDEKRNCIYVAVNNPGKVPHIASLDLSTGKLKSLIDVKGAALFYVSSMTYDAEAEKLYFTTDNDKWRDLNELDIKTNTKTLLQKDVRTGDLAFDQSDKSIWGIKHLNGFSTITRIDQKPKDDKILTPYGDWDQVYTYPYGHDAFDIDVSPDGKYLSAAVTDLQGSQSLLLYKMEDLDNGEFQPDTLFNFSVASPQSFRFTPDGEYLFGSSYYTGVSNIFRIHVESKEISAVSNSLTGLFRPVYIDDDRLFAFNFTSDGFQPVYIPNTTVDNLSNIDFLGNITVEKYPELIDWQIPIPGKADVDMEKLITKKDKYIAGKEMQVNYAYPVVVGYKNNVGVGYRMQISDPFRFKSLDMSLSYTPRAWTNGLLEDRAEDFVELEDEELIHFNFDYNFGQFNIHGGFNEAAFHDLFGPSQSSRKGLKLGVNYDKRLLYDPPNTASLRFGISGFYGLDQSPEYQQILLAGFDKNLFINLSTSINYSTARASLGAVDAEKGIRTSLYVSGAYSAKKFYPRVIGSFDVGMQLPGRHFSLWIRNSVGSSFSETFNPFTRFGFGAFGNNYVDYQATRQYRTPFSLPGISFSADRIIIAKTFAKSMAEFVIPPLRFRKLGGFNFFANWIQPTVFTSVLFTDSIELPDDKIANLGAQIDLRMVTFSLLPSTLSVGYARAWDLDGPGSYNEWMISLKLLH